MGAWSAWQPGVQHTYAPTDHRHTGRNATASTEADFSGAPLIDAKAVLDQHQEDVAAGTAQVYDPTQLSEITFTTVKDAPTVPSPNGHFGVAVRLSQVLATFVGTGHESERFYDPAVFAGMTPGVDYDESQIEYEAATSTIAGWVDWTIDVGAYGTLTTAGGMSAYKYYTPPSTNVPTLVPIPGFTVPTWRIQAFDAELVVDPNDIAGLIWQPYGAGVAVGSYTPSLNVNSTAEQYFGGAVTLTLSDVGPAPILSVVAYSDYQGPLTQPITNYTVAASGSTATDAEGNTIEAGAEIRAGVQFWGIGTRTRRMNGVTTQIPPPLVVYQSPRWRYWRPNATAARLHTVGGHFHSAGGAQINMMQQGGLGPWLPIEDL